MGNIIFYIVGSLVSIFNSDVIVYLAIVMNQRNSTNSIVSNKPYHWHKFQVSALRNYEGRVTVAEGQCYVSLILLKPKFCLLFK